MDKHDGGNLLRGDFKKAFDEVPHLRGWENKVATGLEERLFYGFAKRLHDTEVVGVKRPGRKEHSIMVVFPNTEQLVGGLVGPLLFRIFITDLENRVKAILSISS